MKRKRCTGCGTTLTIKEIKARYPRAPERQMVAPKRSRRVAKRALGLAFSEYGS